MNAPRRRSWLLVPASRPDLIEQARQCAADVIVLDLAELVAAKDRHAARAQAAAAVHAVQAGGTAVFVQIGVPSHEADLDACVCPGLSGVVVTRVESSGEIAEIDASCDRLERARGLAPGTLQIIAALETARGNHAAYEISQASPRVSGLTLGRADLIMDLRPEPSNEMHLMPYLMQRLVIIAGAAGVTPIGAWWRAPDRGLLATPDNTYQAARRGRAIGFKGAMCLRADQVEPLHRAFG